MREKQNNWQRIEAVIKWANMSTNYFARYIGLARGENLYQIKRGNNGISLDVADRIVSKFPQVDKLWLLTGGVFAQLYGTVMLLDDEEKSRIKGTIINKFRGDVEILRPGLDMIENLTNVPVVGVVPYGHFMIDDEDSLSERFENKTVNVIDIAVVRFPRISNFTDFNVFECIDASRGLFC